MDFMPWNNRFVTGIEIVDQQHHHLVDLINGAAPHLNDVRSVDPVLVRDMLAELTNYAATHFRCEEALMHDAAIDAQHCQDHRSKHAEFVTTVARMVEDAEIELVTGPQLLRFLSSWLTMHILSEDQRMATLILGSAGGSPDSDAPPCHRIQRSLPKSCSMF